MFSVKLFGGLMSHSRFLWPATRGVKWLLPLFIGCFVLGCSPDADDDDDGNPGSGSSTPDPADANQASGAGDDALVYLTSGSYDRIHIEIDYMADDDPDDAVDNGPGQAALDGLVALLEETCNKPGGITYDLSESDIIPIPTNSEGVQKTEYSYSEINDLEVQYRDRYHKNGTAILYFLYVNGFYTYQGESTAVIGFAHHGSSMAIMKGMVNQAPLLLAREFYEKSVIRHEVGHLLGLVTTGIDAVDGTHVDNDPDTGKGAHCTNTNCLMYWQVSTADFLISALSGGDLDLDQDCRDDIAAAGGRATTEAPRTVHARAPVSTEAHPPTNPSGIVF